MAGQHGTGCACFRFLHARGALDPGDVDVAVDLNRDDRWRHHFINSLSSGQDPYTVVRVALRGRRRGLELLFERDSGRYDGISMALVWERGESLGVALERLAAIREDPNAGRAPREAMLRCFEGLEEHIPLFVRENLKELVDDGTLSVEQLTLTDAEIDDPEVSRQINWRWKEGSLLRCTVLGYLSSRGR